MINREEIRIRDPFIYTDKENDCYYMYGTASILPDTLAAKCNFSCYRTKDFENFEGLFVLFDDENGKNAY